MVVGTDGYILSVLGPYAADGKNNDASITKHMLSTNSDDINNWLEADDVFIVDRGFRDSITFLEKHGFHVEMPAYLEKGKRQHEVEDANVSRLITKVRWVVESCNGRIKQWRFLDKVVSNHYVPHIGDFVRIVCALCNKYRPALASHDPEGERIASLMLERSRQGNPVKELVERENLLRRRNVYIPITEADDVSFPVLSLDELRDITMGVYQLKLAPAYVANHVDSDNAYQLFLCKEVDDLIRVKIQSRHVGSLLHTLWVQFTEVKVTGWYCTCKVGARVVGCCAHIASVIWYLGYGRHQDKMPVSSNTSDALLNAAVLDSDSETEIDDLVGEE
ncbi:uncharacterized protein LOC124268930 [Haliotis rubra]|uniref:uncharacterized protein LOC124268930 n=1 Tax=Haliotis rubra TaxID=36100 RepID=UPI001EE5DE11|nr:uncharacterized protein LOC124268930 [Haliotis rubra]